MKQLEEILKGKDLRSIGNVSLIISRVKSKEDFRELFKLLFHEDREIVMRAADAIEKITLKSPDYLGEYKSDILRLCSNAKNIELKWHLALLLSRFLLTTDELKKVKSVLEKWVIDRTESKIVRVNSLQSLFNLSKKFNSLTGSLNQIIDKLEKENIPSINARIRKLKNASR